MILPKASPPIALLKPLTVGIGVYDPTLTYTHKREWAGMTFYKTCFARDANDREDWVADVPTVGITVSRWLDTKDWGTAAPHFKTWEEAAYDSLLRQRSGAEQRIAEAEQKLNETRMALLVMDNTLYALKGGQV